MRDISRCCSTLLSLLSTTKYRVVVDCMIIATAFRSAWDTRGPAYRRESHLYREVGAHVSNIRFEQEAYTAWGNALQLTRRDDAYRLTDIHTDLLLHGKQLSPWATPPSATPLYKCFAGPNSKKFKTISHQVHGDIATARRFHSGIIKIPLLPPVFLHFGTDYAEVASTAAVVSRRCPPLLLRSFSILLRLSTHS